MELKKEVAIVYVGYKRRYLTQKSALESFAWQMLKDKYGGEYVERERGRAVVTRLVGWWKKKSKRGGGK